MSAIIGAAAGNNGGGNALLSIPMPAGVLAGHYLLASITVRGDVACAPNVYQSWSVRDDLSRFDGTSKTYVFDRTATGTEPATWSWALNNGLGARASGVIVATSAQTIAGGTPRVNASSVSCTANGLELPISNPLIWFGGTSIGTTLTGTPAGFTLGALA